MVGRRKQSIGWNDFGLASGSLPMPTHHYTSEYHKVFDAQQAFCSNRCTAFGLS